MLQARRVHDLSDTGLAAAVVRALTDVLGVPVSPIALHEPRFGEREHAYVKECLDTGWVSSAGKFVDQFERRLAEICRVRHAIATVNGTAALHAALLVCGVRRDDEVILPALTFVATANAVAHCGAVPHFADSDESTLGLDIEKLERHLRTIGELDNGAWRNRETGRRIAAIVPVHTFGHPVDMDRLNEVAHEFGMTVIEDATEALGTLYKNRPAGSLGRLGTLSFNGNKIVTTGGGGAMLTDDEALAVRARHLTTTAKVPHRWAFVHDEVAYNYRLPNINAALGCAQLEGIDAAVEAKRALAGRYAQAFARVDGLRFFTEPKFAKSNYWLNAIVLEAASAQARDEILTATNDAGFMTRPAWSAMHTLAMYRGAPRMDLSGAESLERRIVNLPSSAFLGRST